MIARISRSEMSTLKRLTTRTITMEFTLLFYSFVLRTGQALIEASSTIVCGALVAGVMRMMVGAPGTRRIFGSHGWKGYIRAAIIGTMLPVCSIGVIPVARELRRSGVPVGNIFAFLLAAPLLNPISFLYGLTLAEPYIIMCFFGAKIFLALIAGEVWEYWFPSETIVTSVVDSEPMPAQGLRRLLAVLLHSCREATGPMLRYGFIALVVSGLLSAFIPFGALQNTMSHNKQPWTSPLLMAAIALPAYMSPLNGMMKLGLMFEHGNSIAAAFVLFVLGIGVNVGLVLWVASEFGWKRTLTWFGVLSVAAILLGYAAEHTLYRTGITETEHTHAFDDMSAPFTAGMTVTGDMVWTKLNDKLGTLELVALGSLALFIVIGWVDRLICSRWDVDAFLFRRPPISDKIQPWWNRDVPGFALGVIILIGLIVFSVVGAYMYYPERGQVFSSMQFIYAELFGATGRDLNKEEAIRRIEEWDLLARKLQVGVYIRDFGLLPEQEKAAENLRERLEEMRDLLRDRSEQADEKAKEAQAMVRSNGSVKKAYEECKSQFGHK